GAAVGLAVASLLLYFHTFGWASIPLFAARTKQSGQDKVVTATLQPFGENSYYFRVSSDKAQWFRYSADPKLFAVLLQKGGGAEELRQASSFVLLPAGATLGSVTRTGYESPANPNPESMKLTFTPLDFLDSTKPLHLDSDWTYLQIRMKP